eukprot:COSAG02_NODE_16902_length_1046_cov_1.192186_2_plen_20_part_01
MEETAVVEKAWCVWEVFQRL